MKGIPIITRTQWLTALLFLLVAGATTGAQQSPPQDQPFYSPRSAPTGVNAAQRFEKEGIRINFSISPLDADGAKDARLKAGTDALVTFRITDAHTEQPVT